jgi:hypothetical protein
VLRVQELSGVIARFRLDCDPPPPWPEVVADLRIVRARFEDELLFLIADLRIGGCLAFPEDLFANG